MKEIKLFKLLLNFKIGACIFLFSISCSSSNRSVAEKPVNIDRQIQPGVQIDTAGKIAKIVFDSSVYHFGVIRQGELLQREIYFTNLGPGDLLIDLISACECTTLDWSRLPIKSGSRSAIKILYNSKDKDGIQIVDVDVIANTSPTSTFAKFHLLVTK